MYKQSKYFNIQKKVEYLKLLFLFLIQDVLLLQRKRHASNYNQNTAHEN